MRDLLSGDTFESSILPVKTLSGTSYGESTILRIKNLQSGFSDEFREAMGVPGTPVVFSGGLFSDLVTWEGGGVVA